MSLRECCMPMGTGDLSRVYSCPVTAEITSYTPMTSVRNAGCLRKLGLVRSKEKEQ